MFAARAHGDGEVVEGSSVEGEARGLVMAGAAESVELGMSGFFERFHTSGFGGRCDRSHGNILACGCLKHAQ
jgi:hypothetical protein